MYMQKAVFCDITNLSLLIEFTVILGFFGIFCRIIKMRGGFKQIIYNAYRLNSAHYQM